MTEDFNSGLLRTIPDSGDNIMGFEPSHVGEIKGSVPETPISANSSLKFCSLLCIYLPVHCLKYHLVLYLLYLGVQAL